MENENFLNKLPEVFSDSASVKRVFGEPVQAGEKIIVPVAQIAYGFGGGFGKGNIDDNRGDKKNETRHKNGKGGGGGGGLFASAKGIYVISPRSEKYIPANNTRQIIIGIGVGFLLRGLLAKKSKK
jgi:uncharacterized spore protein YtfJ